MIRTRAFRWVVETTFPVVCLVMQFQRLGY